MIKIKPRISAKIEERKTRSVGCLATGWSFYEQVNLMNKISTGNVHILLDSDVLFENGIEASLIMLWDELITKKQSKSICVKLNDLEYIMRRAI
tara:strand:- start:12987 stop:13268 length:282 start_codon:yes stop_codon:yes gene_type:complete